MYVVLTGAKKNSGDALIVDRCKALLRKIKPDHELVELPSWTALDPSALRGAAAVIIPGGPGYRPKMYPDIYPLLPPGEVAKLPLYTVGVGWKGIPGDRQSIEDYTFRDSSLALLRSMDQRGALSCRDYATAEVLHRQGLSNVVMSGCPVWYDLDSLGKPLRIPNPVKRLIFTPAQSELFADQSIGVAKVLHDLFPNAEKLCSFHRGVDKSDQWVSKPEASNNARIRNAVEQVGFRSVDVSVGNGDMNFYTEYDLHVGYRVHAHILFTSARLPSLLLHEDGRGVGASEALGIRGIDAFSRVGSGLVARDLQHQGPLARWPFKKALKGLKLREFRAAESVPGAVKAQLEQDLLSQFARYAGIGLRLDAHFEVMKSFISRFPDQPSA